MKKHLIYFVAFGDDAHQQLEICLSTLKMKGDFEIKIISDYPNFLRINLINAVKNNNSNLKDIKISVRIVDSNLNRNDIYSFRIHIDNIIDVKEYIGVLYMDCDFLFKKELDLKGLDDAIYVCEEPFMRLGNKFFNGNLSDSEIELHGNNHAINSGLIYVPNKFHRFFMDWRYKTIQYKSLNEKDHCPEQTVLNSMFFRKENSFKKFDGSLVHFPVWKNVTESDNNTLVHFAGINKAHKAQYMKELKNKLS